MKTLKYLILFSLTFAFVSCSNDDDIPPYPFTQDNLIGKYQLDYLRSKKVSYDYVDNNIPIKITTSSEADTFSMTYEFGSNDTVTLNGTYRITQLKKVLDKTIDSSYIKVFDQEKLPYRMFPEQRELVIDGVRYQVKDYSSTEFTLLRKTKTLDDNGKEVIFKKELRLSK